MTAKEVSPRFSELIEFYIQEIDRYSDEQFTRKPAEDSWSIGQMYEHLALSHQYFFMKNAELCLAKEKGQEGGAPSEIGAGILSNNSFPPIKIKPSRPAGTPEPVAQSRSHYKTALRKLQQEITDRAAAIDADANTYTIEHPRFGALNAQQWFQFHEIHFRHHLRQKRELDQFLGIEEKEFALKSQK